MADHVRGVLTSDMDTDALFEKYTIQEIRQIEKKTRQDIERKKEDLRQMVGERYRDLIEAADTITEMKTCSENVSESVMKMQLLCDSLQQSFHVSSRSLRPHYKTQKPEKGNLFYSTAAQIKLLLDIPEKVWQGLECYEYLRASQLFLLACHVHSGLHRDQQVAAHINNYFPVLSRQWAAIAHFKSTILQVCREKLLDVSMTDKVTAECLCSIILLESSTPQQVFHEFLAARMNAVRQLFAVDESSQSIKDQVTSIVQVIIISLRQVYTIFCDQHSGEGPLLCRALQSVTETPVDIAGSSLSPATKHLPPSIMDFRPVQAAHLDSVEPEHVCDSTRQWVDGCVVGVQEGLGRLLQFISSIKALAVIRDDVWTLLSQEETAPSWDDVCSHVLGRKLPLWQEFLQMLFVQRAEVILQGHFKVTYTVCSQQINRVLSDLAKDGETPDSRMSMERNLASYVWTEGAGDIPPNMAWVAVGAKTLAESGALMMKSRAHSPTLQSLCRVFDHKLRCLLEDCRHYCVTTEDSRHNTAQFDHQSDLEQLEHVLRQECQQCVDRVVDHLQAEMASSQQQITSPSDASSKRLLVDKVLMLGRFSHAVTELCPHLEQCASNTVQSDSRLSRRQTPIRRLSQHVKEDTVWQEIQTQLDNFSTAAFCVWSDYTSQCLLRQFQTIMSDNTAPAILLASTCWDEIEIEEETEDGVQVKSKIRIPMQASWYVQSLLYNLCMEINRIGGHALARRSLQRVVDSLAVGMAATYTHLLSQEPLPPLTQNRALQLLFDFRFLRDILHLSDQQQKVDYEAQCSEVQDRLESHIDPFDLDVFAPHISSHLSRQIARCHVLYGGLLSAEQQGSIRLSMTGGQQVQHNVLELSSSSTRLPLLPITSISNRSSAQPLLLPPKPKVGEVPTTESSLATPTSQSSSFLGHMTTIWFSNVSK